MLALKLMAFALVIFSGVLGRDTHRGNIRHRQAAEEYGYNHPPVPEISQVIPVAVVYEYEDNREDKSIKNGITRENNVEKVSKETPRSEPTVTKKLSVTEVANDENIYTKTTTIKQEEPKPTTYRPKKEQKIPVAIVYEPETVNYQKPSRNNVRGTTNREKILQPALEDKETVNEDNASSSAQVNGHIGTSSMSSATERPNLNKRQKISKAAPEKPTIVKDKNAFISLIPASDKPEDIRQSTQKPDKKGIAMTVDSHTPSTTKANNRQNRQRPIAEKKQTASSKGEQVSGDPPSASKPAEIIKNKENAQQYPKRDTSTRVQEVIPIIQSENVVFSHSGNFKYSYEGGDGTKAFETGELKTFDDETAGEAVSGGFSYKDKDGNEYSLSYTADENGYRPVGAHLPTPPPIPPAIARALAYLATKTTPEPVTKSIAE